MRYPVLAGDCKEKTRQGSGGTNRRPKNCGAVSHRYREGEDERRIHPLENTSHNTVLLIQRNKNGLNRLNTFLSETGYTVHMAGDRTEAVECLSAIQYHVAVLDGEMLRDDSGTNILSAIRKAAPSCRIILIAADGFHGLQEHHDCNVFFTYLHGPVNGQEICEVIESVFQRIPTERFC